MNRGEYLEKIIFNKGHTVASLSKESGVPYTTIKSMIERDLKNASIDNVLKICNVLGIRADDLANVDVMTEAPAPYYTLSTKEIPYYGEISAGNLLNVEAVTYKEVDYLLIAEQILGKYSTNKDLFAMKANGESMNKIIPNGSIVIAKRVNVEELKDEDIVIFSYDGEYSMKRFRRDLEDEVIIFSPESTDRKFRDLVVPFDTQNDLIIHGKVVVYSVTLDQ